MAQRKAKAQNPDYPPTIIVTTSKLVTYEMYADRFRRHYGIKHPTWKTLIYVVHHWINERSGVMLSDLMRDMIGASGNTMCIWDRLLVLQQKSLIVCIGKNKRGANLYVPTEQALRELDMLMKLV